MNPITICVVTIALIVALLVGGLVVGPLITFLTHGIKNKKEWGKAYFLSTTELFYALKKFFSFAHLCLGGVGGGTVWAAKKVQPYWKKTLTWILILLCVAGVSFGAYAGYKNYKANAEARAKIAQTENISEQKNTPITSENTENSSNPIQPNTQTTVKKSKSETVSIIVGPILVLVGIAALVTLIYFARKSHEKFATWGKKIPWEFFLLLLTLNLLARWLIPSIWIPFWNEQAYFWPFNIGVLIAAAFYKWEHKQLGGVFILFLVICALVISYNSNWFQTWLEKEKEETRIEERQVELQKPWENGIYSVIALPGDTNDLRDWSVKNPKPVIIGEDNVASYSARYSGECYYVRFNGEGTGWKRCYDDDGITYRGRVSTVEFMSESGKEVHITVRIRNK